MDNSAILVIDVQVGLITGAYRQQSVQEAINHSISRVRDVGGLVIFIQHNHQHYAPLLVGAQGWQRHPDLLRDDDDLVLQKTASDAFYQTELLAVLRQYQIQHLYITGLQTEFCVDATCRAALTHEFAVTLISDAHTTGDSSLSAAQIIEHHNQLLANLAHPTRSIVVKASGDI